MMFRQNMPHQNTHMMYTHPVLYDFVSWHTNMSCTIQLREILHILRALDLLL